MPSTTNRPALRELRRAAGYPSGSAFARALGIPASTYNRYEESPGSIPLRGAWAIADALGVAIDAVVGRDGEGDRDPVALVSGAAEFEPSYGARVRALDGPGRELVEEWLELFERAGRSSLYPRGRR